MGSSNAIGRQTLRLVLILCVCACAWVCLRRYECEFAARPTVGYKNFADSRPRSFKLALTAAMGVVLSLAHWLRRCCCCHYLGIDDDDDDEATTFQDGWGFSRPGSMSGNDYGDGASSSGGSFTGQPVISLRQPSRASGSVDRGGDGGGDDGYEVTASNPLDRLESVDPRNSSNIGGEHGGGGRVLGRSYTILAEEEEPERVAEATKVPRQLDSWRETAAVVVTQTLVIIAAAAGPNAACVLMFHFCCCCNCC